MDEEVQNFACKVGEYIQITSYYRPIAEPIACIGESRVYWNGTYEGVLP